MPFCAPGPQISPGHKDATYDRHGPNQRPCRYIRVALWPLPTTVTQTSMGATVAACACSLRAPQDPCSSHARTDATARPEDVLRPI